MPLASVAGPDNGKNYENLWSRLAILRIRLVSSIASTFSNKIIKGLWRSTYLMRPWKVCALPPLDLSACSTSSCLTLPAFCLDMSLQLVPTIKRSTPGTLHLPGPCSQQSAWAALISEMSKKRMGRHGPWGLLLDLNCVLACPPLVQLSLRKQALRAQKKHEAISSSQGPVHRKMRAQAWS